MSIISKLFPKDDAGAPGVVTAAAPEPPPAPQVELGEASPDEPTVVRQLSEDSDPEIHAALASVDDAASDLFAESAARPAAFAPSENTTPFEIAEPAQAAALFDGALSSDPESDDGLPLLALAATLDRPLSRDEVLESALRGESLERADLRRLELGDAILAGADLARAALDEARLDGAQLRKANLRGATLRAASLCGVDLRDADLEGADLTNARLDGATLSKTNLSRATLTGASLVGVNLTGARLDWARVEAADLTSALLTDVSATHADLSGTKLTKATATATDLRHADVSDADFSGADLTGAKAAGLHGTGPALAAARAEWLDVSARADGSARLTGDDARRFLRGEAAAAPAQPVSPAGPSRRYFGAGDVLRNASLSFGANVRVEIDSLLENCQLDLGEGASLTVGAAGVLSDCKVVGAGDVTIAGHFFQRDEADSSALTDVRSLTVTGTGALVASVKQAPTGTRFAFERGCRLRLTVAAGDSAPQAASAAGETRVESAGTFIEAGATLRGALVAPGAVVISGILDGELTAPKVVVTSGGALKGRTKAESLLTRGTLGGHVDADTCELGGLVEAGSVISARVLAADAPELAGCTFTVGAEPSRADAIARATAAAQPLPQDQPAQAAIEPVVLADGTSSAPVDLEVTSVGPRRSSKGRRKGNPPAVTPESSSGDEPA